jgi:hypothetical protein
MAKPKKETPSENPIVEKWVQSNEKQLAQVKLLNPELFAGVNLALDYLNKYLGGSGTIQMPESVVNAQQPTTEAVSKGTLKIGDIVVTPKFELSPNSPFQPDYIAKIKWYLKYKTYNGLKDTELLPFMTVTNVTEFEGENFVELMPIWWRITERPVGIIGRIFPTWKIEEEKLIKINYDLRMGDSIKIPDTKNGNPLKQYDSVAVDEAKKYGDNIFLTRICDDPKSDYNKVCLNDTYYGLTGDYFNIQKDNLEEKLSKTYRVTYDDEYSAVRLLCTALRLEANRVLVRADKTLTPIYTFIDSVDLLNQTVNITTQLSTSNVSSNEVTLQTAIESVFHADGSFYLVDAPQNYKIGTKGFNKWSNRTYTLKRVEFYQDSSVNEPRWTFYLETDTVSETITYQLTWNQYVDEYTNQFGMNIPNVSEKNVSLGVHNKTTAEKIQDLANELDNLDI